MLGTGVAGVGDSIVGSGGVYSIPDREVLVEKEGVDTW